MTAPRKFRVWDGEEMHYPPHPYLLGSEGSLYRCSYQIEEAEHEVEGEAMDYTGREDAELTPIYQGDLMQDHPSAPIYQVEWNVSDAQWVIRNLLPTKGDGIPLARVMTTFRVVGNRFENSDLIEEVAA